MPTTPTSCQHRPHPGATVSTDTITGVGDFVEPEVIGTDSDTAARAAAHVEVRIEVSRSPVVDLPYCDLMMNNGPA
ncbi:hypothetical protein [Streptomyces salinarius]|uniref:Uncharacterized protein n=1 Tax=Streptomyces salinarius TaxID=2762598 RepID=A0ABW8BHY3_9ACTN